MTLTRDDIYHVVPKPIVMDIIEQYRFHLLDSEHGLIHWARVLNNGLLLAEQNGADPDIIIAFSLFHDCRRENEMDDPEHGPRGATLLRYYAGQVNLTPEALNAAATACEGHTHILHSDDINVATCWDADRLDLMRVHIYPEIHYLNNREIIDAEFIAERSEAALDNELDSWVTDIISDFQEETGKLIL